MSRCGLLLLMLASACARNLELLPNRDGGSEDGANADMPGMAICSGIGTPSRIESAGAEQCTAVVSALTHRYALCVCSTFQVGQQVNTSAFDSTGLTTGNDVTAAVGINGDLDSSAKLSLGGALHIAGAGGAVVGPLELRESLRVGGPLTTTASENSIGTDAYVAGNITGKVDINGTLHVPAGATVGPAVTATMTVREPVSVPAPCDCSPQLASIAQEVAGLSTVNDNAAGGLAPNRLQASDAPVALDIPCGRFFLSAINTKADVALTVHGRALIAVMGDLTARGGFTITLDPGAEVDLLVMGTLSVAGGGLFGNKSAPSRVRIWIASDKVLLDNSPIVGAVIHAPVAAVSAPQGFELYGSLLSRSLTFGGGLNVHYDRAILTGGVVCGALAQQAVH